jgi:hypothetical protein
MLYEAACDMFQIAMNNYDPDITKRISDWMQMLEYIGHSWRFDPPKGVSTA